MATSIDISDRDLVDRCRQQDRQAQRELFERYKRAMFSTAYCIINDYEHANDALQEAFVHVFEHLDQFAFRSTLGAWIKTIVVRQAIRKQQLEGRFLALDPVVHDQSLLVDEALTGEELDTAIRSLPDGARTIFLLVVVEGYAYQEVAELLQLSEGTIKSQVNYAKKLLRERLS